MFYSIAIKKIDDTMQITKFRDLVLDQAEELSEGIWMGTAPRDDWAGVAVLDEKGEIYSELEW